MQGDDRAEILSRDGYLIGVATMGLFNGMEFSPLFEGAYVLLRPFWPAFLPAMPIVQLYLASLILAVGTVMLGGIGAALYERAKGLEDSNSRSMQIWLIGTMILSLPTFGRLFKMF